MDLLHVKKDQIVDGNGRPVKLRGVNLGGWLMMENFMIGFPGVESSMRAAMARELGPGRAHFFFERLLEHFLTESDIAFLASLGMNGVRLNVNYRHFESDENPFHYLESGFKRVDQVLEWCGKYGVYVVLDLHAVQGFQNSDWHCDNSSRHSFFWHDKLFQDRFVALWEEFARRYKGNPVVAGYGLMNEPLTGEFIGRFDDNHEPEWEVINRVYRRAVNAIRAIDPDHIICLEGDQFSVKFSGLDAPFADNLVYNSHNYNASTFGPGSYPGLIGGERWDTARQEKHFLVDMEGTGFCQMHQVPLWVSEFGAAFSADPVELTDRLRALDEQMDMFDKYGAHWSLWTYKDLGVMGVVNLQPESEYMQAIRPVFNVKQVLRADHWTHFLPPTGAVKLVHQLADLVEDQIDYPAEDSAANHRYMTQHVLNNYVAPMLQPVFARQFRGMSESRLDDVLQSFRFDRCKINQPLVELLKKHIP
jgi:endoglucanase